MTETNRTTKTNLHRLYEEFGQSPWLDNLKRGYITSGALQQKIDAGIRGITSNPTIFAKAIEGAADYDEQFRSLAKQHVPVDEAYWDMVVDDILKALDIMRPVHDASGGVDGFVSIEVAPDLARDTERTIASARELHERINRPNLYVKIPGTAEGVPAIRQMVAEGRNINITLIFSLERYGEVIEAYLSGLEAFAASGGDVSAVRSVASFFVSRVDTEVDRRLDAIGTEDALALRGKAAVAQAKSAYELFRERFAGDRWAALAAAGARTQRPLWASTSTKNPAYPDTLYVDNLIGPDTVNTLPENTIEAFEDHGTLARTIDDDVAGAHAVLAGLATLGIDMEDVARVLEEEGVASFSKSFDELIAALEAKAAELAEK
ncbi:MAG: tal [Acidimicrobiales bacterium]|jgi:transaldolase|nr:tal [Acidimicrobiales bacterium]